MEPCIYDKKKEECRIDPSPDSYDVHCGSFDTELDCQMKAEFCKPHYSSKGHFKRCKNVHEVIKLSCSRLNEEECVFEEDRCIPKYKKKDESYKRCKKRESK